MTKLHQRYIDDAKNGGEPLKTFTTAAGIVECEYCLDSGMLPSAACKLDPRGHRIATGYFTPDNMPKEECDTHVVVKYDSEVGGVVLNEADYTGDPSKLIDTALIRVESRSFPIEITVVDAQYVYRDLPSGVRPGGWWAEPFFQNAIPEGVYVGQSANWTFYNKFCYDHYDFYWWNWLEQQQNAETEDTTEPEDPEESWDDVFDEDDIYGQD